ncbi:MAG: M23 family metallopeptidase [Candidatus Fimenecus sp.]
MQQPREYKFEPAYQSARDNTVPRTRAVRNAPETEKESGTLQSVIAVQLVLCLLLSGITFAVYKTSETRFETLKQAYATLFSRDMEKDELQETFRRVSDFVFKPPSLAETEEITDGTVTQAAETDTPTEAYDGAGGEDLLYPDEITSFSPFTVTGKFSVPVDYKRVTSNFGYRENPVTKEYGFHSGIDLAAPSGTPIYAAYAGTVAETGYTEARGNYIILTHGNGVRTVYCHCSTVFAETGANLKSGEVIAAVGSTGQATGPHLHFEIWLGTTRCNPAWVLGLYADNGTGC